MIDIEQRLTDLLDERAGRVTPQSRLAEITDGVAPTACRRRRRPGAFIGMAAAVALIAGATAVGLATLRHKTPTRDVASRSSDAQIGAVVPIPDPDGVFVASDQVDTALVGGDTHAESSGVRVAQTVPYGDGYLAVGKRNVGFRTDAAVWRSIDGHSWTAVDDAALRATPTEGATQTYGFALDAVAARGTRLVGLGLTDPAGPGEITSWVSDDGQTWSRQPLPMLASPGATVSGLVSTPAGFVAILFDNADPVHGIGSRSNVIRSTDGVAWEVVDAPVLNAAGSHVFGLAEVAGRLIAYGVAGGHDGTASVWHSDDGANWTAADVPVPGNLPSSSILAAAAVDSGLLLVGMTRTESPGLSKASGVWAIDGAADVVAWTTTDGTSLTPVDTSMINGDSLEFPSAAAGGGSSAVIGITDNAVDGPHGRLWSWNAAGFRAIGGDTPGLDQIDSIAAVGDGFVVAGTNSEYGTVIRPAEDLRPRHTRLWFVPKS